MTDHHDTPAFYRLPAPGLLRLAGPDRIAFIQRQTTNDINLLAPGHSQLTVLTSPTARILDVWRLIMGPDVIDVITLPGRGAATAQYLKSRIFFMDKVTVEDISTQNAQFELLGSDQLLAAVGIAQAPALDQIVTGPDVQVIGLGADRWLLSLPEGMAGQTAARLTASGAAALTPEEYEVWRIESGLPGPTRELTEDYTPLEVNLNAAISDRKGCYTGQEVIARQITYDKVTRRLVGLRLDKPVTAGAAVQVDGRSAGEITSSAVSPRCGVIALGVIKRPHFAPGTEITVLDGDRTIHGVTAALPFGE